MSGECGYPRLPFLGVTMSGQSGQLAIAASATLEKLNSLMRQMNDWRDQRLELESNVRSLKAALQNAGKNPDETLKPDPLVVHQREEINRLELTKDRLEDEIQRLRVALLEADQAITCSGAKRLKDKMTKIREERTEERRKLKDEIGHLKLRVQEAEDDSSCSALSRLRRKLREILNGDKKMERVIADVASRSCGTVIDLSNELTRIKEMLDELRLENIKLRGESRRLKTALESALNGELTSGCSGHLETIERLSFHVKELERKIKEFEDDSGLVKRVEELEDAFNGTRKELEDQESVASSLRNELLGAKAAYKLKSQELVEFRNFKTDVEASKGILIERDKQITDLQQELEISASNARDVGRLRDELNRVKPELLNLEIERDGLLDEIEKTRGIVSDRNEHIVKILEDNEERDKARRSEIEGVRTKLCIASVENERLKSRCDNLEGELAALLFNLNEMSKASGDSAPLLKKIQVLEEELVELKGRSYPPKKDLDDSNSEFKNLVNELNIIEGTKVRLENELADMSSRLATLRSELTAEKSAKADLLEESRNFKKDNDQLKSEAEKLALRFEEELNELKSNNTAMKNEIEELKSRNVELVDKFESQSTSENYSKIKNDTNQPRNQNIQVNYNSESELERLRVEYEAVKNESRKLSSAYNEVNNEVKKARAKVDELDKTNEELNETLKAFESLSEKLEKVEEQLDESLEAFDDMKMKNEELKNSLKREKKERAELVEGMEKLRLKVEEQSKTLRRQNEGQKFTRVSETKETSVMDCGDYVRADRELKYYIHLQSLAVKRVADFISYVDGTTSLKPAMATFLEPTTTNVMVLNFDENVTATFRMSQKLSEKIFDAEINVQRLEILKNERNHLRAERDCLNKGMEKLTKILSNLAQDVSMPRGLQVLHEHCAPPENETRSWNKIPAITAPSAIIVEKYPAEEYSDENLNSSHFLLPNDPEDTEEKFWAMNRRISALRQQIKLKQHEAAQKLIEIRETMREERIQLMEIADRGKVPRTEQLGKPRIDDRTF